MTVYPVGLSVSTAVIRVLAEALAARRSARGARRRLGPGRQALLVLARLRDNVPFEALATGFGVGVATAHRYVAEGCQVLAEQAPTLAEGLERGSKSAYLVLDGTVVETDRVRTFPTGADRGFYSGKTHRHGMNVQVVADAHGDPVWVSPALPGGWHDVRCAKTHGLPQALSQVTAAGVKVLADKGYTGIGGGVTVPYRAGRIDPTTKKFTSWDLSSGQRAANAAHARLRAPGERANAQLKAWKILRRYRGSPEHLTTILAAIHTLITAGHRQL